MFRIILSLFAKQTEYHSNVCLFKAGYMYIVLPQFWLDVRTETKIHGRNRTFDQVHTLTQDLLLLASMSLNLNLNLISIE